MSEDSTFHMDNRQQTPTPHDRNLNRKSTVFPGLLEGETNNTFDIDLHLNMNPYNDDNTIMPDLISPQYQYRSPHTSFRGVEELFERTESTVQTVNPRPGHSRTHSAGDGLIHMTRPSGQPFGKPPGFDKWLDGSDI